MHSAMTIPSVDIFHGGIVLDAIEELICRRIVLGKKEVLLVIFCVVRSSQLTLDRTLILLWFVDAEDIGSCVFLSFKLRLVSFLVNSL
jgi:hypothetical protein